MSKILKKELISNWYLMISILAQITQKTQKKYVGIILNVSKNVVFITKLTFYNENTMNRTCAIILGPKYAVCIYQKVNIQERVMAPTTTTIYNPITAMEFSAMVTS